VSNATRGKAAANPLAVPWVLSRWRAVCLGIFRDKPGNQRIGGGYMDSIPGQVRGIGYDDRTPLARRFDAAWLCVGRWQVFCNDSLHFLSLFMVGFLSLVTSRIISVSSCQTFFFPSGIRKLGLSFTARSAASKDLPRGTP